MSVDWTKRQMIATVLSSCMKYTYNWCYFKVADLCQTGKYMAAQQNATATLHWLGSAVDHQRQQEKWQLHDYRHH